MEIVLKFFFHFNFRYFLCSATQQIPLCETRFDVGSSDTSFVIKDQMSWSPSENGTDINGHGFVPNVPKTEVKVDEEDPYEKIEIRKVQSTPPAVETVAKNATKKEKSQSSDKAKGKKEISTKNKTRNRSEDPSNKSLSEERFDEQSEVETGIKIICQISEVENKMQFKVEEKIISMKPEEVRKREITAKAEEGNKNSFRDISSNQNLFDVSSERKSKESEDKEQVASHIENTEKVQKIFCYKELILSCFL